MTTRTAPRDLVDRLASEDDILVAYLFGSRARGRPRLSSDVDVAVLLAASADLRRRELELRALLGDGIDLVVLNDAPVALAYRVLRAGVVLLCRDDRARAAHWVATVDRYLDSAPMRRVLDEGVHRRLREGHFGRP